MASKENGPSIPERAGELAIGGGLIAGAIGIIGLAAKSEFAASFLFPGGVAIVTGAGLKFIESRRRKNKK